MFLENFLKNPGGKPKRTTEEKNIFEIISGGNPGIIYWGIYGTNPGEIWERISGWMNKASLK